ncbi:hypothetical protein MP228_009265 [Amoeboaphelidium protococcarum]|nr:hypothetical protein MP228_009265 [Amoeboaphelidium protococcarum]
MYQYIEHSTLKQWIETRQAGKDFVIVDVRQDDHAGGNIVGSVNVPAHTFADQIKNLLEKYNHCPDIVFHCMQSQQRGPKCAMNFSRYIKEFLGTEDAAKWDGKVYVLKDGFIGWQAAYRDDSKLIENYDELMFQSILD